jgi:hypothetical protein
VTNKNEAPMALVVWSAAEGGDSFVQAHQPLITYLLGPNEPVVLSVADGVPGSALSAIYSSTPMQWGQIANTWVEFTTGSYGTINVSREPNMNGNRINVSGMSNGCVSDSSNALCSFQCKPDKTEIGAAPDYIPFCGKQGSFELMGCNAGSNPGGQAGKDPITGDDSGGCLMGDFKTSNINVHFY